MATWAPLRQLLAGVDDSVTLTWEKLDRLVGGLPPSAHTYREFWSGDRSAWQGFTTRDVRMGQSVTFQRVTSAAKRGRDSVLPTTGAATGYRRGTAAAVDLLERAAAITGITDHDNLVERGLEALIKLEAGRRLAVLGGTDRAAAVAPRRRGSR